MTLQRPQARTQTIYDRFVAERPICDVEIGHLTSTACHLGNLAIRTGQKITWNSAEEKITGSAELAAQVDRSYREF